MVAIFTVLYLFSAFVIFWGMIGYKQSLKLISHYNKEKNIKSEDKPTVTVMIVAHNEEKVIFDKLNNVILNDYNDDKIEYVIASDNSTDLTNDIVEKFIYEHPTKKIRIYKSKKHLGKTNAQNEAQQTVRSEILIMTDANSMFMGDTISELVGSFTNKTIAYVTGRLSYTNADGNITSDAENTYWTSDLEQRKVESSLHSVTAGNGAVYACRNALYHAFKPIECHDISMPKYYVQKGYRAIYNEKAVAYEKAGETSRDEFQRKVRMNRTIISDIKDSFHFLNPIKYKWFSYCWFGHRFCRYTLWIAHFMLFLCNIVLLLDANTNIFFSVSFFFQILFYTVAITGKLTNSTNRSVHLIYYYVMTIVAQFMGAKNQLMGKSKSTWNKAESTR